MAVRFLCEDFWNGSIGDKSDIKSLLLTMETETGEFSYWTETSRRNYKEQTQRDIKIAW